MRVVPLAPSNTEILLSLGAEDLIVGSTRFCKLGKSIGGWIDPSVEEIEKLRPDMLLGSMYVPESVKEWAERNGVELYIANPRKLEDVYTSIRDIGRLVSKEAEAEIVIASMKADLGRVRKRVKDMDLGYKPRIYSEEFHKPPMVGGNWVPELIKIAGGIPMVDEGNLSKEVSRKQVERFCPDFAILHWCGFGKNVPKDALTSRGWGFIKKSYVIEDNLLNRPSPSLAKGAVQIRRAIEHYIDSLVL